MLADNEAITLRQICIPSEIQKAQEIMVHLDPEEPMLEREKKDLSLCFERLLAARQVCICLHECMYVCMYVCGVLLHFE